MIMQTAANEFTATKGNTVWTASYMGEVLGWWVSSSRSLTKAIHPCRTVADVEAKFKAFRGLAEVVA